MICIEAFPIQYEAAKFLRASHRDIPNGGASGRDEREHGLGQSRAGGRGLARRGKERALLVGQRSAARSAGSGARELLAVAGAIFTARATGGVDDASSTLSSLVGARRILISKWRLCAFPIDQTSRPLRCRRSDA